MKIYGIVKQYKGYMETFGVVDGNKMFFERIKHKLGHSTKKQIFAVKIKNQNNRKIYLRANTTDTLLAYSLLKKGGEYDFLLDSPYRELSKSAKTVVDAGANVGLFSVMCQSICKQAYFVCVEPEANNYDILNRNMLGSNTCCMKNGLWNKKANLLVIARDTGEWGFVVQEVDNKTEKTVDALGVIDIMKAEKLKHIDILKIDIEGSEYEVFDDSSEAWIDKVDCIIVELHDRIKSGCSQQVEMRMKQHGFVGKIYGENHVFVKTTEKEAVYEC